MVTKNVSEEDMMAAMIEVDEAEDLGTRIDKEQARARAGLVINFQEGDVFTMRTLDFANTPSVIRHDFWPEKGDTREPIHTVCPRTVKGQRCEYHDRGEDWMEQYGIKTIAHFLVQVYWVDFERVSILAFAANGASPIPDMRNKADNLAKRYKGKPNPVTLDMCDLVITQEGTGMKRKFAVDRQAPEDLPQEALDIIAKAGGVWSKPMIIARYIRAKNPELLGVQPEAEDEDEEDSDFHIGTSD